MFILQTTVKPAVQLFKVVEKCNKRLEPLGMKIQSGKMEQDGSEWIGLVNTYKDEVAKRATHLTLVQLDYFKIVVSKRDKLEDLCGQTDS